jgi:hypothetical protein
MRMSKSPAKKLKDQFLVWQCKIRQDAMRHHGGRPSPGMRPRLLDDKGHELAPHLTVLLLPKAPGESTAFFRFQVMKSSDARETYQRVLAYLQADSFQEPAAFSDRLLAVLPGDSPLAAKLAAARRCLLSFAQGRHGYSVPCKVRDLDAGDEARVAAVWHNRVFNSALPETVHVVVFRPDWTSAWAEPRCEGQETMPL